jgi:hypothetical protein
MMMQVKAVHALGTMPQAMEFDLSKLDFIQKKALSRLPRSPQGVPELRALVKADGPVAFKFKVPPDKLAWESLPELLTLWEERYTKAMCKVVANLFTLCNLNLVRALNATHRARKNIVRFC